MQNAKQVIKVAKQNAQHKFSALVQRMAQHTDNELATSLSKNPNAMQYRTLTDARQFLRQEGNALLANLENTFQEQMERGMRTMYTDLRAGLSDFTAETLTLIDDETVNRQIEVGHLVDQLRNACDENLGRLNIMISQVHDSSEVVERENPFRPYLIARTLHEVLCKMVSDEDVRAVLFKYTADSLALYLPEYYAELCDVFDIGGIKPQLIARPGSMRRHQREQLTRQTLAAQGGNAGTGVATSNAGNAMSQAISPNLAEKVVPTLERLLKLMQQQTASSFQSGAANNANEKSFDARNESQSVAFQDFVSNIFAAPVDQGLFSPKRRKGDQEQTSSQRSHGNRSEQSEDPEPQEDVSPVSEELLARLNEFQKLAARGRAVNEEITPLQNQLFSVREQINEQAVSQPEQRMAMDVIAVLFEFILGDEQIPEGLRAQIGRLQIPFLKAAMLEPGLLQLEDHPSRQLLNRIGTVAVGLDTATEIGQSFSTEIKRIVRKILDEFDKDVAIFSTCLEEFNQFLTDKLRNADSDTARSIDALEEAEKFSRLTLGTTTSLREILLPLNIDKRMSDFIMDIWTRVLVRASMQDIKANIKNTDANSAQKRCSDLLPELVWSAQNKQKSKDRHALMRLLPNLVKSLKDGMTILNLSEKEGKQALDQLVAVHTQVLRNNDVKAGENLPSLDDLRHVFSALNIQEETILSKAVAQPQVEQEVIEASLAERGVSASLDLQPDSTFSSRLDETLLAQMQIGACVECWIDNAYQLGRLIWMGNNQSLFMFRMDKDAKPLVYTPSSLSKAMRQGLLNLIEAAPTFERAVESLLQGTEAMQQKPAVKN
ncbi:MAG TPA: DUF1631 family protein [Burkholderiaceae bacterium]|jgi:hypothetical protein